MKVYIVLFLLTLKYCEYNGADSSTGVPTTTPLDATSINYEEPSSTQEITTFYENLTIDSTDELTSVTMNTESALSSTKSVLSSLTIDSTDELTSVTTYTESALSSTESVLSSSPTKISSLSGCSSASTVRKSYYKPGVMSVDATTKLSSATSTTVDSTTDASTTTAFTTANSTEILTTSAEHLISNPPLLCANPPKPSLFFEEQVIYADITEYDSDCKFGQLNITCYNAKHTAHKVVSLPLIDINDGMFMKTYIYTCTANIITTESISSPESNQLRMPPGPGDMFMNYSRGILEWNEPFVNVTLCYTVIITRLEPNHYVPKFCNGNVTVRETTSSTFYAFTDKEADYVYQANVSVKFWGLNFIAFRNFLTAPAAPGAPIDVSVTRSSYEKNVYSALWYLPCDVNGNIKEFRILLNNSINKIVKIVEPMKDYYSTTLNKLNQSTVYNLTIYAVGEGGRVGKAAYHYFTTDDGIPDEPVPSITDIGPTHFNISWPEIDPEIAKITNYEVSIDIVGSVYDKNRSCPKPDQIIPFNTTSNSFSFTEAWPSYIYDVMIIAYSNVAKSLPGFIEVTTQASVPEAPYNLKLEIYNIYDDNSVPSEITWDEPCKINGVMKCYHIMIFKSYTEDPDNTPTLVAQDCRKLTQWMDYFEPSHLYIVKVAIVLDNNRVGEWSTTNNTTPVGYPGIPIVSVVNISQSNFIVKWEEPREKTGAINIYDIYVQSVSVSLPPLNCDIQYLVKHDVLNGTTHSYYVEGSPFTKYSITMKAATERGYGNTTTQYTMTTEAEPENASNITIGIDNILSDEYNATVNVFFFPPCNLNGYFRSFTLECTGIGNGSPDILSGVITYYSLFDVNSFRCPLRPEYAYSCTITTSNNVYNSTVKMETFRSPAGAPNFAVDVEGIPLYHNSPEEVQITLRKGMFNNSQGTIKYFALILSPSKVASSHIEEWDEKYSWPRVYEGSRQLTPNYWNPFEHADEYTFTIGSGTFENPGLKEDTIYFLTLRIFTESFFRDSDSIVFKTDTTSKLGVIIGVIVALLIFAVLGVAAFFIWKKGLYRKFRDMYPRKSATKLIVTSTTAVPLKKFIQYVKNSENKPELLKEQYSLLKEKSEEIHANNQMNFAGLVENKRKNRYTNILPYDATRVKLRIDEDDEIGSDYINASYVKGYSGRIEYIATQGPLPNTCRDFWRMVLQENVTIIAMVSNFVENNKQKCHKYFPDNHENLIVGDNMEIRCATELHFGTYLIRNLQIRKDCLQTTVIHMQFLKWPDFGVPSGTEHMLQFCYQLRERARMEGGLIIVHCSAGVGRTGTLIAADMLLQTANAGRALDIFRTVLQLRQQRVNMVQTADQYIYLHRLIADHIDRPPSPDNTEISDPVYENMDIIRKPTTCEYKLKEEESQF